MTMTAAAAGWPTKVAAQQSGTPVIGFLSSRSQADSAELVAAFRQGLADAGYIEGRDAVVEYQWADGQYERLSELVRRRVAVIAAVGGEATAQAAKRATATIPIVFAIGGDPVKLELVRSYNRPGGNMTGVSILMPQLEAKRLSLLHDLVPNAAVIALLLDPRNPPADRQRHEVEESTRAVGSRLELWHAADDAQLDTAFEQLSLKQVEALLVAGSPFFDTRRNRIVALVGQHRLPAIYAFRSFVLAGGLMSYGIDPSEGYRQVGRYTGRILKGASPADLPVVEPTKFELVINMKTAKTLGLTVPQSIFARADEVIE